MNRIQQASFAILTLAVSTLAAQTKATAPLQKGIRVVMAASSNAVPMPDADNQNAFIVTVLRDGAIYLGVDRIAPSDLKEKVRSTPFKRGQKIYIKADARTPYASLLEVLEATSTGGIAPQVLLTAHTGPSPAGAIVAPEGVEVQLGPWSRNSP